MKIRIKDLRQHFGIYQSEMARIISSKQSTISRMEMRPSSELTQSQVDALYERFGKEEVERFADNELNSVIATGNVNQGDGTQNNGLISSDKEALEIIKEQSKTLSELATKQAEQSDRLLSILEKLSDRL